MSLALFLALQAAPQAPDAAAPLPLDFDLAQVRPHDPCDRDSGDGAGEIVVCGRRPGGGGYDLEKWERVFRAKPLVAEMAIGGSSVARAYVESVEMPRGEVSKRAMIGIKARF